MNLARSFTSRTRRGLSCSLLACAHHGRTNGSGNKFTGKSSAFIENRSLPYHITCGVDSHGPQGYLDRASGGMRVREPSLDMGQDDGKMQTIACERLLDLSAPKTTYDLSIHCLAFISLPVGGLVLVGSNR